MKIIVSFTLLCLFIGLTNSCKEEEVNNSCEENTFTVDPIKIDRKVLIIGIDGFRSDVLTSNNAPFLFALSQSSDTYFTGQSKVEYYTSSGPNWTSLLTGVHWEKHLVENNFFSFYEPNDYPTFFKYIESASPSIHTAAICHWVPINYVIVDDQADYNPIQIISDLEVATKAIAVIDGSDNVKGDVIFLHFDDLDHYGHANGFHDTIPEYVQAVNTMDIYVQDLFSAVEARRIMGEDWLVFIVSDHGGEGREHSDLSYEPNVNQTIFFANHPTATFRSNYISSQADLAPSVLSFLGIQNNRFNCYKDGQSIFE
jgi:predicted AlkP superfamily pyrophosphatase or phosphodiesterase